MGIACVPPTQFVSYRMSFRGHLYEHHCYRKYSDKLDESSEGFFWEEFYHTDSEQKAPIPITGSIRRFSENEPQLMLSQAKIWKGTFSRLATRKNQALMPMYSILLLLNIAGKLTGLLSDGERMSVSLLNSLVSRFLRDTNGLRPVNEMRLFSLFVMLERIISLLYRIF